MKSSWLKELLIAIVFLTGSAEIYAQTSTNTNSTRPCPAGRDCNISGRTSTQMPSWNPSLSNCANLGEARDATCVLPYRQTITVAPPVCTGGRVWNGTACVCPAGTTWDGANCIVPPPVCTGGQFWNGVACVCPAGQTWDGSSCTIPPPVCTGGQTWNGVACVCPGGTTWNGSSCVAACTAQPSQNQTLTCSSVNGPGWTGVINQQRDWNNGICSFGPWYTTSSNCVSPATNVNLDIAGNVTGGGQVTITGPGINCSLDLFNSACSGMQVPANTNITVQFAPNFTWGGPGQVFYGLYTFTSNGTCAVNNNAVWGNVSCSFNTGTGGSINLYAPRCTNSTGWTTCS